MPMFISQPVGLPLPRLSRTVAATLLCMVGVAGFVGSDIARAANASVGFFLSEPGVQGPSLAGVTIEDFEGLTAGAISSGTSLTVGTVSAASNFKSSAAGWAGASTTGATSVPYGTSAATASKFVYVDAYGSATINLTTPSNYVGFHWAGGDAGNTVFFYSGGNELARFSTADIMALVPKNGTPATVSAVGGATYTKNDYWGKRTAAQPNYATAVEPFAYVNVVAPNGVTFDQIKFTQAAFGFEFDNLAVGTYSGSFDTSAMVGIPSDELADDTFSVESGATLSGDVAANDTLVSTSTFSVVSQPSTGTVTMSTNGSFRYTASTPGTYTFTYKACRSTGTCVTATGTITVTSASTTTTSTVAGGPSTTTVAGGSTTTVSPGDTSDIASSGATAKDSDLPDSGQPMWILSMAALVLVIAGLIAVPRLVREAHGR